MGGGALGLNFPTESKSIKDPNYLNGNSLETDQGKNSEFCLAAK